LPAPEAERGVIDPPTGDIVPPGEQSDRNLYVGPPRHGPDNPKPPTVIEGEVKPAVEGSWTGPADGPPPWLRKVPPVKSEDRPPATPPQTKSGGETGSAATARERRSQRRASRDGQPAHAAARRGRIPLGRLKGPRVVNRLGRAPSEAGGVAFGCAGA